MELSARYVYQVYQKKSFSAAAKSLFVSQPALSASVARLEAELGFRIFDRSTSPLSLTPAGQIYIESLEEIMESERHMQRRIHQLSESKDTTLSVGSNAYSAYYLLSGISGDFVARYPHVRLRINTHINESIYDELRQQTLDLALTGAYDPRDHYAVPLLEERIIIAMHRNLVKNDALLLHALTAEQILSRSYTEEQEIEDFSLFHDIPFFRFRKGSLTYQQMAKILGSYAATPHTMVNAPNRGIHYSMMCAGLGALLTNDTHIAVSPMSSEGVVFFVPRCPESHRTLYLVCRKDLPQNHPAHRFIEIAAERMQSGRLFSLLRNNRHDLCKEDKP